jgi:mono/diheme cytochrome c family protein
VNTKDDQQYEGPAESKQRIDRPQLERGLSSYEQSEPESLDIQEIHRAVLREQFEPSEGQQRVPIFLFLLFIGLAMWAGWYLSEFDGNFQANVYDGPDAFRLMDLSKAGTKIEKTIDPVLLGKRVFNNCITCHQASGEGIAGQYPPLNLSEWVTGDEKVLARILLNGLTGPIEVNGKVYNAQMPAWKQLSDRDIAAVLTYIRQAWENKSPAITEDTIATVRASVGERGPWTAEVLKSLVQTEPATTDNPSANLGTESNPNQGPKP